MFLQLLLRKQLPPQQNNYTEHRFTGDGVFFAL